MTRGKSLSVRPVHLAGNFLWNFLLLPKESGILLADKRKWGYLASKKRQNENRARECFFSLCAVLFAFLPSIDGVRSRDAYGRARRGRPWQ